MSQTLEQFAADILEDGIIDAEEVQAIRVRIYADGQIDQEEADFMFALNDGVSGKNNAPGWSALFVEAITDFVLADDTSPGVIDDDEAAYLIEKIEGDGQIDGTELALLVNICDKATGESPDRFNTFVLDAVKSAVVDDGIVDADEVEMMKKVVYGAGGPGGSDVDRDEADMIFAINDATTDNEGHDGSWQAFFVEAIAKHVLEDEASPGAIDDDEAAWLIARIEGDGKCDGNEKALLAVIRQQASAMPNNLSSLIDTQLN